MKLKAAIILSVVFHLSLFAIAIYIPTKTGSSGTVYRVDLIQMPAGGQSKAKSGTRVETRQRMKDLTAKKQPPKSKLQFPNKKNKKKHKKKKKKDLIS
ncbi:MAG: hypothetical protein GY940_42830, partial [bacterium]|nr:hypothetical protein [bacterium]